MTYGIDDYEKAIARIFDLDGKVIGAGFLVAPGYVVTCAHVVLQAIGVERKEFPKYTQAPRETVRLDFPVLANGQKIDAEVTDDWLPYEIDDGDVAGLRLLQREPAGALPMPLEEHEREAIELDRHAVYGFGVSVLGGRSDDYYPKAQAAGGRFQMCRHGNSADETIQGGFSGAAAWNRSKNCAVGAIATAKVAKLEEESTAYLIPTRNLRKVLNAIRAYHLHDLLTAFSSDDSKDEQYAFRCAISLVLRECNPNGGNRSEREQLRDLSCDRPPAPGWEEDGNLARFAARLARHPETNTQAYDALTAWVGEERFQRSLARLTREDKENPALHPESGCEAVIVTLEAVEKDDAPEERYRVSLWAIASRDRYDRNLPPKPLLSARTFSLEELPKQIVDTIRKTLGKKVDPFVHLFVPCKLLCCDAETRGGRRTLLGDYVFSVRINPKTCPQLGQDFDDDWNDKWARIESSWQESAVSVLAPIDCRLYDSAPDEVLDELEGTDAATLSGYSALGNVFGDMVDEGIALPVVLWSRDRQFDSALNGVLDGPLGDLPRRVREIRGQARGDENAVLGRHLSLMWEDPKIVPPDAPLIS